MKYINGTISAALGLIIILMISPVVALGSTEHQHEAPSIVKPKKPNTNEKSMLQTLIDDTESGGTLQLEGRIYRGSMTITKPITIIGVEGTKINSLATALTITDATNVTLQDIVVQAEESAIVASNVQNLQLSNVEIRQSMAGILVQNSENIQLNNVSIIGKPGHFSTKGHAVAVYESKNLQAVDSEIDMMMDGFYFESVDGISLNNNRISNSRYAVHMMYSDHVRLEQNHLTQNMTGFMVMVTKNVHIEANKIIRNNSLNSLGVYAHDVEALTFTNNELQENTTAMDVQNAHDMVIEDNKFSINGTVLQVKRSPTLNVRNNEFYGNILSVRSDKQGVLLQQNFYDDYDAKDYDGDGIGDTHYIATNSFGQWMVQKPVYQYFMESPSVVTLNMMDTEVTGNQASIIVDEQPVVKNNKSSLHLDVNGLQLFASSVVLAGIVIMRRRLK